MNAELIAGLRATADFLEAHPDLPRVCDPMLTAFVYERQELARIAHAAPSWDKDYIGDWMSLRKCFGPVKLDFTINRDKVCRKVVSDMTVPAVPERVLPATPERTVEHVEWVCDEALLSW